MAALPPGKHAPQVSLPDMHGKTFSLQEALKKGPALLAFFKITCPVCQMTMPVVERLRQAYPDATIVGVSQNPKADTQRFLDEYGISMKILLDPPGSYPASNAYGMTNVPTLFYVGRDGKIEVASVGWSKADLEDIGHRLAKESKSKPAKLFKPGEDFPAMKAG